MCEAIRKRRESADKGNCFLEMERESSSVYIRVSDFSIVDVNEIRPEVRKTG